MSRYDGHHEPRKELGYTLYMIVSTESGHTWVFVRSSGVGFWIVVYQHIPLQLG